MGCLESYEAYLREMEKSEATIEKYVRDIRTFYRYLEKNGGQITKERVIAYKSWLKEYYKISSAASMLVALNQYLKYLGLAGCCVRNFKVQQQMFASRQKELTREEYRRLIWTAQKNGKERLALLMETIGGTGIRISELQYITVEAIHRGRAEVACKGKNRQIYLTRELRKILTKYCKKNRIQTGPVFRSRNGKPLDRSNIWSQMKKLGKKAKILAEKIFPHNLRHFFARIYYKKKKDIFYLADILGHSNVNTTRIYTMTTGEQHVQMLESLGLVITT